MSSLASSSVFARLATERMSERASLQRKLRSSWPHLADEIGHEGGATASAEIQLPKTSRLQVAALALSCAFATNEVLNHKRQHRGKVDVQGWLVQVLASFLLAFIALHFLLCTP